MKKLILVLTLVAFAFSPMVMPEVQAASQNSTLQCKKHKKHHKKHKKHHKKRKTA